MGAIPCSVVAEPWGGPRGHDTGDSDVDQQVTESSGGRADVSSKLRPNNLRRLQNSLLDSDISGYPLRMRHKAPMRISSNKLDHGVMVFGRPGIHLVAILKQIAH